MTKPDMKRTSRPDMKRTFTQQQPEAWQEYALRIVSAVAVPGSIEITFERGSEAPIVQAFALQDVQMWLLRNLLEACGKQVPRGSVSLDLDELVGMQCGGRIIDDGGTDVIIEFFSHSTEEENVIVPFSKTQGGRCAKCGGVISRVERGGYWIPTRGLKIDKISFCMDCLEEIAGLVLERFRVGEPSRYVM